MKLIFKLHTCLYFKQGKFSTKTTLLILSEIDAEYIKRALDVCMCTVCMCTDVCIDVYYTA